MNCFVKGSGFSCERRRRREDREVTNWKRRGRGKRRRGGRRRERLVMVMVMRVVVISKVREKFCFPIDCFSFVKIHWRKGGSWQLVGMEKKKIKKFGWMFVDVCHIIFVWWMSKGGLVEFFGCW